MNEDAKRRLAEISLLQQALQAAGPTLRTHLDGRRADLIAHLVSANSEETRGRIKELDELLELSERLRQEAAGLTAPLQEEGELP